MAARSVRAGVLHALVRRDYQVSRSYRIGFALDLVFGFFNLILYFFISRTFAGAREAPLGGAPSYFAFAAVGAALSLVVQATSLRVTQRVREEQLTGTLEAVVAQPVSAAELALGLSGFHFLFGMVRATLYILLGDIFLGLGLREPDWLGFAVVVVASGAAMTCIGIALSAAVLVFKRVDVLIALTTFLLALIGGAYFPISVLPGWLEPLARILPTRFAFDGVRAALFRGEGWAGSAGWLLLFTVVALPAAIAVFAGALRIARRQGALATY